MIKYNHKTFKSVLDVVRYRNALDSKAHHIADFIKNEPYAEHVIDMRIKYQGLQEDLQKFDKWLAGVEL